MPPLLGDKHGANIGSAVRLDDLISQTVLKERQRVCLNICGSNEQSLAGLQSLRVGGPQSNKKN